jgi:hypothetical protein
MLGKIVRSARRGVYSVQRARVRPKKRGTGKTRKVRSVRVKKPKAAISKRQLAKDIQASSRSVLNAKLI